MAYTKTYYFLQQFVDENRENAYFYTTEKQEFRRTLYRGGYNMGFTVEKTGIHFLDLGTSASAGIVTKALREAKVRFEMDEGDSSWNEYFVFTTDPIIEEGLKFVRVVMQATGAEKRDIDAVLKSLETDLRNDKDWHAALSERKTLLLQYPRANTQNAMSTTEAEPVAEANHSKPKPDGCKIS